MEHSPYSQSPSPSSSLVNFPTPTNLPDIRLHRPFSQKSILLEIGKLKLDYLLNVQSKSRVQMHDLKHLHSPFNLRFMENYPALPAHLLHHLQSPFLHPALDPRVSFSPAGVFQPLGPPSPHHQHPHHQHHSHHAAAAAAASLKGFTSAFAPPSKCYKMDDKQASHAEGAAQQQQQQQQQPPGSHQQHHQQQQHQLQQQQQQQQQQPVPPSFPYPPRRSPCSPGNMPVSPPSSSAAATMHQQHKDECSDRDTPSSGAVSEDGRMIRRKKLSPPMTTAPTTTPAANGSGSATSTATTGTVNNNNNHSNNNNNGSSIKQQQQQQQQSSAGGQQLMSAAAAGCCPVCGTALRTAHELESHFIWELERLYKQAAAAGRRHRRGTPDKLGDGHHMHGLMVCPRDGGRLSPVAGGSSRDATLHGRWETYQKVKANRHNRLRIKNRKRKPDEMLLTPTPATCCCPVCSEPVAAATQEQMNAHVEMCLRNKGHPVATAGNDDEDENVDVEGDAETTMYDIVYGGGSSGWHGQQPHNRMRQQQMLMHGGGYNRGAAAVAMNCTGPGNPGQQPPPRQSASGGEDPAGGAEDAVLVVDDNDNENGGSSGSLYNKYGPNQYAERDVIVPSRPPTASSESRRLTPAELNDPSAMEAMDSCENVGPLDVSIKKENTQDEGTVKPKMDVDKYCAQFNNNGQVVEALKARIRELESVSKTGSDKFTCLLCKGNFKDPVVSTSCWHVYCEVCWLQILGAKKLCPQCYVITLPSNLRRVYL